MAANPVAIKRGARGSLGRVRLSLLRPNARTCNARLVRCILGAGLAGFLANVDTSGGVLALVEPSSNNSFKPKTHRCAMVFGLIQVLGR